MSRLDSYTRDDTDQFRIVRKRGKRLHEEYVDIDHGDVRIDEGEKIALRHPGTLIAPACGVPRQVVIANDLISIALRNLNGAIRATAVGNDHFILEVAQLLDALQCLLDGLLLIERGYDY